MIDKKMVQEQFAAYTAERKSKIAGYRAQLETANLDNRQLIEKCAELLFVSEDVRRQIEEMRARRRSEDAYLPLEMTVKEDGIAMNGVLRVDAKAREEEGKIKGTMYFPMEEIEAYKARKLAKLGGVGRAKQFADLEVETIRLYLLGTWGSVPEAALQITPKIVQLSKQIGGGLLPTTTKPLQWIRAYNRSKSNSS